MSLSGASGSAAGYANLILKIAIFVISINTMIDMLYLRVFTCYALLVSTSFMFMMTLMMNSFDKHIYYVMFMHFLLTSYLWNKLNMKLSRFLTTSLLLQKPVFRSWNLASCFSKLYYQPHNPGIQSSLHLSKNSNKNLKASSFYNLWCDPDNNPAQTLLY